MSEPVRPTPGRWPQTLRGRLMLWLVVSSSGSLVVFAAVVFVVFVLDELAEPSSLSEAQIDWATAADVGVAMAFAFPLVLLLAGAGSFWLSRRILAPIRSVIDSARRMTASDLRLRLTLPEVDDELRALVVTQNDLFERLERGFDDLSQFAANTSHEIRSPLAVVTNELEVALRRPRSSHDWEQSARRSLEELRRIHRLVDTLLELARGGGVSQGVAEQTAVRVLVLRIVAAFERKARRKGISIEIISGSDDDARVAVSEDALDISLSNLLKNAILYTPEEGRITLRVERRAQRVRINVEDSGPGVATDEAEAIFAPFGRGRAGRAAEAAGTRATDGLGLGLSIARRIVEQHGGALVVDAGHIGGGSFSIELPVAESSSSLHAERVRF